jgi:BlaI family transcriptional regulator, penicillinase repressor
MVDSTPEPRILTRAESEIMSVLWSKGTATVHDVVGELPRDPAYTSVLTMLRILEKKGYVTREPEPGGGRAHVYRPLIAAHQARRQHVRDLIDRLFGGRSEELMVGLLEDDALSRGELEQLRGLIESRLGGDAEGPSIGAASVPARGDVKAAHGKNAARAAASEATGADERAARSMPGKDAPGKDSPSKTASGKRAPGKVARTKGKKDVR